MKTTQRIGTMLVPLLLISTGCSKSESLQSISLSFASDAQQMNAVQNDIIILDYSTTPEDITLDASNFEVNPPEEISLGEDTISFKVTQPGEYTVHAEKDGIKSNAILIQVAAAPQDSQSAESTSAKPEENAPKQASINGILNDPKAWDGERVSIEGELPQAAVELKDGSMAPVIWNDDQSQYLILTGSIPAFGGCRARLTGTIEQTENGTAIHVESSEQISGEE